MQTRPSWSDERGIAMVVALFMVLLLSLLGSSMMFVANTETVSSLNYKTMSQARYAAESGVHSAANHLLFAYAPPSVAAPDLLASYDLTQSPVAYNGAPVVLSSSPGVTSNYPVNAVRDAFIAASQGTLTTGVGTVRYSASARLLSMRQITDTFTNTPMTIQTWEITGRGTAGGLGSATVEVSAIVERQETPVFRYAAFATDPNCDALTFGGGASTDSYDSSAYGGSGTPTFDAYGGNVGTNGGLTGLGNTTIVNGTLSSPRTGVGNCNNGNITAADLNGATISDGLIQLPQAVTMPAPPPVNPLPPTTSFQFSKNGGCPGGLGAPLCVPNNGAGNEGATLTPETAASCGCANPAPLVMGNVSVTGGAKLHLAAGTYIVNSLSFAGNSELVLDSGPVIFRVAGQSETTPIDFTGGTIANDTYDPSLMQFLYGGTGKVKLTGGSSSAALVYAPSATASFSGGLDFYGSVVAGVISDMGGATIHYDRRLDTNALTVGNPVMSAFSWRSF